MMAGAISALPASTGPLEFEGGRWWPPVGDFGLGAAVWPAVARLDLDMVSSKVSRAAGIAAQIQHIGIYSYCQANQAKPRLKLLLYQWLTVALRVQLAMSILAGAAVVNTVAVAKIQIALGAVPPNRQLHEPGKGLRECSVERPGIDPGRARPDDVGTAVRPVASSTVRMVGTEPVQDAGAVQEVVHQRVDGDHAGADIGPQRLTADEQQARQRHHHDLVRHAIDLAQRSDQGLDHPGDTVWVRSIIRFGQLSVDPSYQVAIGDIPDKQEQTVRRLVQAAIAQRVLRQRTARQKFRLIAGP